MLVVLLAVFIVCWTPVHVLELMPLLDTQHEVSVSAMNDTVM